MTKKNKEKDKIKIFLFLLTKEKKLVFFYFLQTMGFFLNRWEAIVSRKRKMVGDKLSN